MKRQGSYRMTMVWLGVVAGVLAGGSARADFTFGKPMNLGPTVNSSAEEYGSGVSPDGLELYFHSNRSGGWDIWLARRPTTDDEWGTPVNLGPTVNSSNVEWSPRISCDGLSLYLSSDRPGGHGSGDLYVTTRKTKEDTWGPPANLGPNINSPYSEDNPTISADDLSLFFSESDVPGTLLRPGGYGGADIWVSTRLSRDAEWGVPINLGPTVNSASHETVPCISSDGLMLLFGRGSYTAADIWLTRRKTRDDLWQQPVKLGPPVNSSSCWEGHPNLSADGSILYFNSYGRPGGYGRDDLWQVAVIPVVDFNGDGKVDSFEVYRMVDRWGTDGSFCDIGPMPWGDGVVDVKDLKVLAAYIGKELEDPTLVAHWALDETEGLQAADSAAGHDGTVTGAPIWRPGAGKIDGALELDGRSFIGADHILSPADGPFSVLAWVKGGAPGQVILSQRAGANWLTVAAPNGVWATDLKGPGRSDTPLVSQTVIAGGDWHRVGLVWDGSRRTLYVDDVAVAEDAKAVNMPASIGATHIGAGSTLASGTFWKGLIDDVRIYNRAVKP